VDLLYEDLVIKNNPLAPNFVGIVRDRERRFTDKLSQIKVSPFLKKWSKDMMRLHKKTTGRDYIVYGHQPVDYLVGLLCLRYGMDEAQWPKALTKDDKKRAEMWSYGIIAPYVVKGERVYHPPIAGGAEFTNYFEAELGNSIFRTGLTAPTVWAGSAAKTLGDVVKPTVWNDTLFECVVAGTTAASPEPTWPTTIGGEVVDGTVTWQAAKIGLLKRALFFALYSAAPGETGGGTELSYVNYTRVALNPSDANWTSSVQLGGFGRNDNAVAIVFPAPDSGPQTITDTAIMSRLTGGNFFMYSALTASQVLNNGDPAPSFPIGSFDVDIN